MSSRIKTLAKAIKDHPEDSYYKFTLALEMLKIEEYSKARILFESIKEKSSECKEQLQFSLSGGK